MTPPKLLMATRNAGKQREIHALLAEVPWEIVFPDEQGLGERIEEAGLEATGTYEGNARRKAEFFARWSHLPTAAEDSGLEVLSLGGIPGVHSRRFSFPPRADPRDQDEANNTELMRRLAGAPRPRRRARYRAAVVYLSRYDAAPLTFSGECSGSILEAPRGAGGFGYDPLFFSDDLKKTFGEASDAEKATVSHRARALRSFAAALAAHPPG